MITLIYDEKVLYFTSCVFALVTVSTMLLSVHAKPFEKLKLSKYFSLYTKTDELIYFCRIQQRLRNEWQAKKNKTRSFFLSLGYREVQFRSEKHHKSQIHGTTKSITSWEHRRQKHSRFLRVSLTSVFHAPVLLLTMNFVITLSKYSADQLGYRLVDPQLLWLCYDEIHDQQQDRRMKNWHQVVKLIIK